MNNDQFRNLVRANSAKSPDGQKQATLSTPSAAALGSRQKSSIPMTPRSVTGTRHNDFARQLAERNQGQPQKKFRSAAPKGSKFSEGYVDRARQRNSEEEDERAVRIKALEESLKKEEIDQETFDRLRNQIAGGDLSSTHLVKGLDFKLLQRIRKGEDVYIDRKSEDKQPEADTPAEDEADPEGDVDDAFEELEDQEVTAVAKEKAKKKGQFATASLVPGKKRTRDQILAELKAAREAAKAKEESALGGRFKKIGAKKEPGTRIERDSKGREVLIIIDEDGNEKRKVRKVAAETEQDRDAYKPDPTAKPLGMEVPDFYKQRQQQEEEDEKEIHVFSDAGSDYDPLAGLASGSDDSDESEAEDTKSKTKNAKEHSPESEGEVAADAPSKEMAPPPKPQVSAQSRNYFKDSRTALVSEESGRTSALNDPSVLAALKKAKTLNAAAKSEEEEQEAARQERLKKMLQSSERDDEDLDMGFGTNRLADEEDLEETKIKLSAWGDDDDGGQGAGGKSKRKRGPKKRKGDVNSAADVLKAMERRKAAES